VTRWIGLEKIRRRFLALPKHARTMVDEALVQGADEIVTMQKRLVEVDDGELRDSIHWEWIPAPANAARAIRIRAGNARVRYAHLVEFGTAPHRVGGRFAGAMHPGTAPAPFFYPAYRALKKRVKGRVRRSLRKAVLASRNA
jgi:HK97 gp10 family phage protein